MHLRPLRWQFPEAYRALISQCQIHAVQAYDITASVESLRSGENMLRITAEDNSHTWERVCHVGELELVADPILEFFHLVAIEAAQIVSAKYLIEMNHRPV